MTYDSIPEELRALKNWVGWKLEERNGEKTKVPYSSAHDKASSTDPKTWRTFEEVCGITASKEKGIGFVFDNRGIVGIDLDHCLVDNKIDNKDFVNIVEKLNSYTEVSPSGTGLHIFIRCTEAPYPTGKKKGNVEIYSRDRYFTVTGNVFRNKHINTVPVETVRALLDPFVNPPRAESLVVQSTSTSPTLTDDEIVRNASNAQNGAKFERLMSGSTIDHGGDDSSADEALACILAFWTQDPKQIERIMRSSGLRREKWDTHKRYLGGYTIPKALRLCTTHFEPKYEQGNAAQGKESADNIMKNAQIKKEEVTKEDEIEIKKKKEEWMEDIKKTREDSKLNPFPELPEGIFRDYVDVGVKTSYSHKAYHFGSLLTLVSMILRRKVCVRAGIETIYPNIFVFVVGLSTVSGKSSAVVFPNSAIIILLKCPKFLFN